AGSGRSMLTRWENTARSKSSHRPANSLGCRVQAIGPSGAGAGLWTGMLALGMAASMGWAVLVSTVTLYLGTGVNRSGRRTVLRLPGSGNICDSGRPASRRRYRQREPAVVASEGPPDRKSVVEGKRVDLGGR